MKKSKGKFISHEELQYIDYKDFEKKEVADNTLKDTPWGPWTLKLKKIKYEFEEEIKEYKWEINEGFVTSVDDLTNIDSVYLSETKNLGIKGARDDKNSAVRIKTRRQYALKNKFGLEEYQSPEPLRIHDYLRGQNMLLPPDVSLANKVPDNASTEGHAIDKHVIGDGKYKTPLNLAMRAITDDGLNGNDIASAFSTKADGDASFKKAIADSWEAFVIPNLFKRSQSSIKDSSLDSSKCLAFKRKVDAPIKIDESKCEIFEEGGISKVKEKGKGQILAEEVSDTLKLGKGYIQPEVNEPYWHLTTYFPTT